jgi:hypothetical protein
MGTPHRCTFDGRRYDRHRCRRNRGSDSLSQLGWRRNRRLDTESSPQRVMDRELPPTAHASNEMRIDLGRRLRGKLTVRVRAKQLDQHLMLTFASRTLCGGFR